MPVPTWCEADSGVLEAQLQCAEKKLMESHQEIEQLRKFVTENPKGYSSDDTGVCWDRLCSKLTSMIPALVQISHEIIGNKLQEWETLQLRGDYTLEQLCQPLIQLRRWVERITQQVGCGTHTLRSIEHGAL